MWWQSGTIYQIYPRSFQDSGGDGVGDLAGMRRRLPYLRDLGIEAVWLSPIFRSPMRDFGYDISDYCDIDPVFGTMADFDALLEDAHRSGLKLLLDFVPNHTSDEHRWFRESASARDNPKRDWYIWKDAGPDGGPPNNWVSNFGGSAWEWHESSGQYYYHAFLASQPDLNWRNPAVRGAMFDVLRFWLDKGVDGFRVDVIWHLIKDRDFRDNPLNPAYEPDQPEIQRHIHVHSADQPEVHKVIAEMRKVLNEYEDRLLIGEIYLPLERLMAYYGEEGSGVHLPFNFQLLQAPWRAGEVARIIDEYERELPANGWPNWVLSNHDKPRIAARVGERQAANAALLLLTLRGTPTIYYGDEIGIAKVTIPLDRIRDPWAIQEPETSFDRDHARTPMQWSADENAGFSTAEPWLPLTDDWPERNVQQMSADEGSLLSLHRRLLKVRRAEPALQTGSYRRLILEECVMAYERTGETARFAVVVNFSAEPQSVDLPEPYSGGSLVLSTRGERSAPIASPLRLGPDEGVLIRA
ncbi:MAG TPA: alpha-amylase family glycosyl hydrolase [Novosphingobium sp.]|nr:alpha-amylase family glycosyl hydrolase [Novosphingobium sp.]